MVTLMIALALFLSFLWEASPISTILPFQFLSLMAFIRAGRRDAPYFATICGLLLDIASGTPLGVFAFALTISSLFLRWITQRVLPSPKTMFFLLVFFLICRDLVALGLLKMFSAGYSISLKSYIFTLLAYYPIYRRNEREYRKT